jgi:hypothetical protein
LVLRRARARLRRWGRQGVSRVAALLPPQAERELFSARVRYLDRHAVIYVHDSAARERAARLLARHLNSVQRRCLRHRGFFVVTSRRGRRYRIWARRQLPVELIDARGNTHRHHKPWLYCVTTDGLAGGEATLPLADQLLELKLCLEADESYFLVTSNPNFIEGVNEKNELLRKSFLTAKRF